MRGIIVAVALAAGLPVAAEERTPEETERAFGELEAWRARHAELSELARVFSAIDETRGLLNP